jgi:hypothetical protein
MSARSRRQVLRGGVAVGVAGLAGCLSVPGADGGPDAPRDRRLALPRGGLAGVPLRRSQHGPQPRREWTRTTDAYELGSPTVADGVVYVGASGQSGAGTLLALDGATGEERWRVETREVLFGDYSRAGINASPAVVDGVVYVATAPGEVYARHEGRDAGSASPVVPVERQVGRESSPRAQARLEPVGDRVAVGRARDHRDGAVADGDDGLFRAARREPTAGTGDPARGPVVEQVGRPVGAERAGRREPTEVVVTADDRDPKPVDEQYRERVPAAGLERGPARGTGDAGADRW